MPNTQLALISLTAGMAISLQSSLSGQLSQRINNPLLASASVYLIGLLGIAVYLATHRSQLPAREILSQVPLYLWLTGGLISALALSTIYKVMPDFGVASTLLFVICGQLLVGAVVSHFAWFGMPAAPLTPTRLASLLLVLAGASLYNYQPAA
ncbi:DMT family transporter [Pelagicoccus sp. SDUM812002]|uniref:DMT family transporter n=1 Tax=Pelagicoccus sp. SDUM812002 TaxID=3041266 RepID=UPI00280F01A0|nr:DMT family transporter [Pelagicoccus sp. SDUM812002]MDQ8187051.1 DMT family transporter [Pelagicoccus sp. SDUM812002]